MNNKYQIEIDEFTARFGKYKDARIILYGIGRYTATLLEGVKGFQFTGLMDKDPANIGKTMFGLPIVGKDTVEQIADMVVINTSETYWRVIYDRIQDIRIPVFFKNGEKAERKESIKADNPLKDLSYNALCLQAEAAEVISFDFFDTLFMRSVCDPQDIFRLIQLKLKEKGREDILFTELRDRAKKELKKNYSLDELYLQMETIGRISHPLAEEMKSIELKLEKKLLVPRKEVISCLRKTLAWGRDVYIISDMYLPEGFYRDVLEEYGIMIPAGHILLSHVLDASKSAGTMWKYYFEVILKDKREASGAAFVALHVGDDHKADVLGPVRYGIHTYHAPGAWELLGASSMREIASHICRDFDSAVMGCVLRKIFQNPYALEGSDGKIQIKNNQEMGYCVFGPVVLTFLLWLLHKSGEDERKKLIFMSRDGYFLKEDFEYLCKLSGIQKECCYLGISRQLAMTAAIGSKEDLMEYLSMPYTGSMEELFEDRLGVLLKKDSRVTDNAAGSTSGKEASLSAGGCAEECLLDYVEAYLPEIEKNVSGIREDYLYYIKEMELDDTCAVVDLGYYGNNQKYLNKLAGTQMSGYYFNVNLSEQNRNAQEQKMTACFQKEEDRTGEKSQVLKRMIYLESFLTAPYGMVKAVDKDGNFVCAPKKKNQEHFPDKAEINQGVKQFISDYMGLFGEFGMQPDREFVDRYYGYCMDGALAFAESVKSSFYNDNGMMNRIESMLFY